MKKAKYLFTLFAALTLSLSACTKDDLTSSSSSSSTSSTVSENPTEGWSGEVASLLQEVFGSSDVIPYLKADNYLASKNFLQGTEIPYVSIDCVSKSTTLVNDYGTLLEGAAFTLAGYDSDIGFHVAFKNLDENVKQIVCYAYFNNYFRIYTYRDEPEDLSDIMADWPEDVAKVLKDNSVSALPGIKSDSYEANTKEEETGTVVHVYVGAFTTTMVEDYGKILDSVGFTLVEDLQENGYYAAVGQVSFSAYQFVYYNYDLDTMSFHIYTFIYDTAIPSDGFPSEQMDKYLSPIKAQLPVFVGDYDYKYYPYSLNDYEAFVVEFSVESDPFAEYINTLKAAGYAYHEESEQYYLVLEGDAVVYVSLMYFAEIKTALIVVYFDYGTSGTSDTFPVDAFSNWLVKMIGLSFTNKDAFKFEAESYTYQETSIDNIPYFIITGKVEEDPTESYIAYLTGLNFVYDEVNSEYVAIIAQSAGYKIYLFVGVSYDADAGVFSVTFSLSAKAA